MKANLAAGQELSPTTETDDSLVARFERAAAAYRSRTAIISDVWQPTYEEFNVSANRLAHALLAREGAAGDRVAILMQHDSPLIAAILAVLKAGRIAIVLRPADHLDQTRQIMDHVEPNLIVADLPHRALAAEIAGANCPVLNFADHAMRGEDCNPHIRISPGATAVLVYSSGTTGRHNAVMWTHRQLVEDNARVSRGLEILPEDRISHFAAITTGSGVKSSLLALLNGAALCPFAAQEKGMGGLSDWMLERKITVTIWPASFFRHFIRTLDDARQFPRMRVVRIGGESGTSEDFAAFRKHFLPGCAFVHNFACAEVGTIAHLRLSHGDSVANGQLPAGRPLDGIEVSIEDKHGNDVGPGEIGEITVRGRALAAGYWRDASLTAARFSQGAAGGDVRVFRGGDLGRFNADGLLEYVGRKDAQVKVRGFRVILTDVEDAVSRMAAVESAAVCAFDQPNGDVRIVAYVVLDHGASTSGNALRRALRATLPDYMVPSAFVVLDRLPLSASGKVDREKLRHIKPSVSGNGSTEPPRAPTEQALAEIWAEEFGLPRVGRDDDFFSLGGDSLRAAVIQARIQETFGVKLDLGIFADHPTLAAMASIIEKGRTAAVTQAEPPLVRVPRSEPLPLSSNQESIWINSQTPAGSAAYRTTVTYRVVGPLDPKVLAECLSDVTNQHEILRTTYSVAHGRPVQVVHPPAHVPVTFADFLGMPDADQRAAVLLNQKAAETLDLEEGPIVRFSLLRMREHEHWLLRSAHHIASDGWSWKMFMGQLAQVYEAKLRGEPPPLSDSGRLQYADYAVWQRNRLRQERPEFQQTIAWWKDVLSNPPPLLQLPFRRPVRLDGLDPNQGIIELDVDPRVTRRLAQLGRDEGATYYTVRLAAFVALLGSVTGQSDILFGIYATQRNRADLQDIFGFFANLVALRFRFEPGMSFRKWLQVVGRTAWMAMARSEIPYDDLRGKLQQRGVTAPDINLIFGEGGDVALGDSIIEFADLRITWLTRRQSCMPWGFSIEGNELSNGCTARFDAGIYDPVGVRNFITRYIRLLDAASQHPELPLFALLDIAGRDFENRVQDELQELKDRIRKQDARIESIARAFSRARHQTRRIWLRPPLWTSEQYSPRKLNVQSTYQNEKMPSDAISIAIVTPAFNYGRYLSATIDSVLMQDYPRLSYMVQDGGSSDNTVDILRSYGSRLTWRSERDGGQAQAINRAFATCEGEAMAYLNSDDMLLPGTLAYVARVFAARPDIDIVYGHRIFVDRDGLEIGRAVLPRHDAKALYWASYVPQETMFWRRRVWDSVGPFDESFQYALDWDFTLRAQHAGFKFLRVPRFLACFRVHDEQKTAAMYDVGRQEMQRLRSRYLGYAPTHPEVIRKLMPYLLRQLAVHWAYRLGIVRC